MRYWSATHTPVFDAGGSFRYILQHTTDVTELQGSFPRSERAGASEAEVFRRAAEVQATNRLLSTEVGLIRSLFQQAPGFMAVLSGPDHVFELANAAFRTLVGRQEIAGRTVAEALPEVVEQGFIQLLDHVVATGEPFVGRGALVRLATGREGESEDHFVDFVYQPFRDAAGKVAGVFVQGHDITEQKRVEQELSRQTEVLRLAQDAGGFGTFEWDIGTGVLTASRTFKRLYGFDEDNAAIPVGIFRDRVHPEDRAKIATESSAPLEDSLRYTEYRIAMPDGGYRWVGRQGTVIYDDEGAPARVVGAVHDITQRKQFEARLETVAQESAHRVKNLLAIVQAIVSQTLRRATDINAASDAIRQRLMAIGATQTALVSGSPAPSDLGMLVRSAMELHGEVPARIRVSGPDLRLDAKTALGLTLVLHELGTNAVKYGALSTDAGHVGISWTLDQTGTVATFEWRERGGPPVAVPTRQGFGSSLIRRSLPPIGDDSPAIAFDPEGVVFTAPLAVDRGA
jgi:PAS domain S-box-containing protein